LQGARFTLIGRPLWILWKSKTGRKLRSPRLPGSAVLVSRRRSSEKFPGVYGCTVHAHLKMNVGT
jgi:hypothetical protein